MAGSPSSKPPPSSWRSDRARRSSSRWAWAPSPATPPISLRSSAIPPAVAGGDASVEFVQSARDAGEPRLPLPDHAGCVTAAELAKDFIATFDKIRTQVAACELGLTKVASVDIPTIPRT